MRYSYYPGCTLKTRAKDLDRYAPVPRRRHWGGRVAGMAVLRRGVSHGTG